MKIKVSEATGPVLGFMVKKALGDIGIIVVREGKWLDYEAGKHRYATDWAQGGPIIDRGFICIKQGKYLGHEALAYIYEGDGYKSDSFGQTPLIAAMRCYVTSKLGDMIEVPEELLA